MTYLVLFGEVRSLLRTSDFAERQDQMHHSLIIRVFTSGLGNWNSLLAAAKYCVFQWGHKFSFFPSIANVLVEFVYMLDDIYVSICGDDFMTYGVFIVAQLLPKPPGFGLNKLACKLKNHHSYTVVTSPNGVPEATQRLVHKLSIHDIITDYWSCWWLSLCQCLPVIHVLYWSRHWGPI